MKKASMLFLLVVFLSGCATYRFQWGQPPYEKGYTVSRDDYIIPEYTLGKDNTVPANIELAQSRFKKRRTIVEDYYKKMGYIENHFKMAFWGPCAIFFKAIGGVFRLPFIAISDYKYGHNPEYRKKMEKIEEDKEAREETRIEKLKEELNIYIQKDLARESVFKNE